MKTLLAVFLFVFVLVAASSTARADVPFPGWPGGTAPCQHCVDESQARQQVCNSLTDPGSQSWLVCMAYDAYYFALCSAQCTECFGLWFICGGTSEVVTARHPFSFPAVTVPPAVLRPQDTDNNLLPLLN